MNIFQKDLINFFQKEGVAIINSKLRSIRKNDLEIFPKLKSLSFADNEFVTIEFALLANNHHLKRVSFANNQLIGIGNDLTDNLEHLEQIDLSNAGCVNKIASNEVEIETLKSEIAEKCRPTDDMQKVQET